MLLMFTLTTVGVHAQDNFKGTASFYADKFEGRKTASGVVYTHDKFTCAHKTLPFGTKLRVTNLSNNKSVIVTVNDRGPFVGARVIDLSKSAAKEISMINQGLAKVQIEILDENGNYFPIEEESLDMSEILLF